VTKREQLERDNDLLRREIVKLAREIADLLRAPHNQSRSFP